MNSLFGPHMYKNSSAIGFPWLVCLSHKKGLENRCSAVHHTTVIICIRWPRFRVGDASSDPLRIELLLWLRASCFGVLAIGSVKTLVKAGLESR